MITVKSGIDELMRQRGRPLAVAAGASVWLQGESDSRLVQVETGLLKAVYVREDGREFVKSLLGPDSVIASLAAAARGGTCTFTLQAVERSELRALDFADVRSAAKSDPTLAQDVIELLIELAWKKEQREFQLLSMSAEERYAEAVSRGLGVEGISQAELASYLGITPPALSRIKKRIRAAGQDKPI